MSSMRTMILILGFLVISSSATAQLSEIFVERNWLRNNMDDPRVVILHVGTQEDYNTGHIPGATLITSGEFSTTRGELRWELPDREKMKEVLISKGVTDRTINILYFGNDTVAPTFRLYFTMSYFGLENSTFILNGGMTGWYLGKYDSETRPNTPADDQGRLHLTESRRILADKNDVLRSLGSNHTTIIDARRNNFFTGEEDGDGYYKRPGHIPNAINITWTDLFDDNTFLKPENELRNYFREVGEMNNVITYCHVGLRASVVFTVAKYLGYRVNLYDGSFNEWDTLPGDYPVEKGN